MLLSSIYDRDRAGSSGHNLLHLQFDWHPGAQFLVHRKNAALGNIFEQRGLSGASATNNKTFGDRNSTDAGRLRDTSCIAEVSSLSSEPVRCSKMELPSPSRTMVSDCKHRNTTEISNDLAHVHPVSDGPYRIKSRERTCTKFTCTRDHHSGSIAFTWLRTNLSGPGLPYAQMPYTYRLQLPLRKCRQARADRNSSWGSSPAWEQKCPTAVLAVFKTPRVF